MSLTGLVGKMGRSKLPVRDARIRLTSKACKAVLKLVFSSNGEYQGIDRVMNDLAFAIRAIDQRVLPRVERTTSPRVRMYDKATGETLYIIEQHEDEFVICPAEGSIGRYAPGHVLRAYVKNLQKNC